MAVAERAVVVGYIADLLQDLAQAAAACRAMAAFPGLDTAVARVG